MNSTNTSKIMPDNYTAEELVNLHKSLFVTKSSDKSDEQRLNFPPPAFEFKKVSILKNVNFNYSTNTYAKG